MPTISEAQLAAWTQPAFNNEDERRQRTEGLIRESIRGHALLSTLPIDVYAKGSYKNNTNVRRDSDVDIAVEYTGIIYNQYGPDTDHATVDRQAGLVPYSGPFRDSAGNTQIGEFKDAVGQALRSTFGSAAVTRSNKVFTVRESSRSLAADVVPCTTYRMYWSPQSCTQGIRLLPDIPPPWWVVNYPQQHYDEGVAKNNRTGRSYKRIVRIVKNLENKMVEDRASPEVASYLIESLVFNVPNTTLTSTPTWALRVRNVLGFIWEDTDRPGWDTRWLEANRIKYLFHQHQKWTRDEARDFVDAAWQYVANS